MRVIAFMWQGSALAERLRIEIQHGSHTPHSLCRAGLEADHVFLDFAFQRLRGVHFRPLFAFDIYH